MFKRKSPYSPNELALQAREIREMITVRDRLYNDARLLNQKDPSQAQLRLAEADRMAVSIKTAQHVYNSMLTRMDRYLK